MLKEVNIHNYMIRLMNICAEIKKKKLHEQLTFERFRKLKEKRLASVLKKRQTLLISFFI